MPQAGQGVEDQRELSPGFVNFRKLPASIVDSLLHAWYRVQAHCESTEGPKEQAVPGHVSRSSFFWVQFYLLPSTFILSGLQGQVYGRDFGTQVWALPSSLVLAHRALLSTWALRNLAMATHVECSVLSLTRASVLRY